MHTMIQMRLRSGATRTHRSAPSRARSASLVVRCQHSDQDSRRVNVMRVVQGTVASCAAAALLVLHPSPALAAETSASKAVEAAYEQEATVQESKSMLEFMLQQQENAKRAALLSQRQQLQAEVGKVEAALQARLNQQKANVIGAQQAGDARAAENATAAATQLEEKQAAIIKAAAKLNSQLDRMELVERARAAAAKQTIEKAAQNVDATVNARLNPWLEALGRSAAK